ncbi:uncharacterized protein LOC143038872 isoform X2 [Oratosquilla oratoria]|uniref:uncharacterized protein LOC143038872 isoform X2 n=1 Tax=Oratosquilla oratoria TaxID=337810 RepID=UPI003F759F7E
MLNCLLARQLCADAPACRSILELIPRVCGPENVACSTVTVNKCVAALRTLQVFPDFQPTCLCREPHLDRECNTFREFIFDHPCNFVVRKGSPQYPITALPTCDYAQRTCGQLPGCIQLYETFQEKCKVQQDQCRMEDGDACLKAWTELKTSPMFGCFCPNQKRKCLRIFDIVHHNPCVDSFPASLAPPSLGGAGAWGLLLPPPPTPRPFPAPVPPPFYPSPTSVSKPHHPNHRHHHHNHQHHHHQYPHQNPHATLVTAGPSPAVSTQTQNIFFVDHSQYNHTLHQHQPDNHHHDTRPDNERGSIAVSVIPHANETLPAVDTQIQNPLLVGQRDRYPPTTPRGTSINVSRAANVLGQGGSGEGGDGVSAGGDGRTSEGIPGRQDIATYPSQSSSLTPSKLPIPYSTCQSALKGCEADPACHRLLNPILNNCDNDQCNQKACMDSLQTFYRNVETKWAMEVAFCLCRKRGPTANECLTAQEKLHPACARKPTGPKPIPCNELAFDCKEDKSCRHRLEYYEQACAVDSDTKRCAGSCVECRRAVLGILGTKLRHICTCVNIASEPRDTYACLDWQKILWFNPCVHDSQTDLHRKSTPKPPAIIETSPTAPPRRITTTTTTAIPTTTLPPKYCVKEAVDYGKSDLIVEGGGKRYYTVDDQACSELCQCHKEEKLVCNVLNCVEARHCETTVAVYDHNAPTFKAGQGNCICYSGSFICVRSPDFNPDEELGYGIHLYLGFSSAEEALLNDYTHLTVDDAVKRLQKLVREREDKLNATSCNVETVRHVGENLILQATLPEFDELRDNMTASMYNEEKEKCVPALEEVSDLINDQAVDIRSDISLSMFILAEVRATVPDLPSSSTIPNPPSLLLLLLVTFCTMLLSDGGFKSSSSSTSTRRSTSNITITTTIPITNSSSSNNSNSSNSNTLKYWVVAS